MIVATTYSEEETFELAEKIAARLVGGEVIFLNGRLGAGKTAFTKGLAKSLGITQTVTSPTFTIMKEYAGRLKFYHFDLYRIEDAEDLTELGLNELLFDKEAVCVIEWNKFDNVKPTIEVFIEYTSDNERQFRIEGTEI